MTSRRIRHFYYPSTRVACGGDLDSRAGLSEELGNITSLRSETTCAACRAQFGFDAKRCVACAEYLRIGSEYGGHAGCDPEDPFGLGYPGTR